MATTNTVPLQRPGLLGHGDAEVLPESLHASAELLLAGRADEVHYQDAIWIGQRARQISARLVASLATHPHGRPRADAAAVSEDPSVLEALVEDDLGVSCVLFGNPAASSDQLARVLRRWRAHPLNRGADWSSYVLSRAVRHPALDEESLESLPAKTVEHYNKARLAVPGDPPGTGELVAALARDDHSLSLGQARERARFIAGLPS